MYSWFWSQSFSGIEVVLVLKQGTQKAAMESEMDFKWEIPPEVQEQLTMNRTESISI